MVLLVLSSRSEVLKEILAMLINWGKKKKKRSEVLYHDTVQIPGPGLGGRGPRLSGSGSTQAAARKAAEMSLRVGALGLGSHGSRTRALETPQQGQNQGVRRQASPTAVPSACAVYSPLGFWQVLKTHSSLPC